MNTHKNLGIAKKRRRDEDIIQEAKYCIHHKEYTESSWHIDSLICCCHNNGFNEYESHCRI